MKTLVSVCLLSALASTAFADFRSGVAAYQRGNDVTALQEFWTLAHQGHAGIATGFLIILDDSYTPVHRGYRGCTEPRRDRDRLRVDTSGRPG